ncbi:MBOAT family O-acyltransferase [Crocosphaera sp. XPORK-15E]|uniref:MBOAT family O-acyltransferase n=1 Tax=Crocosphaera sp. XPORK-15E TaxID=3110247 RepID=UPI002B1F9235|nr:MBOAT family O-acyltransferase [Crocosphaera sp. XPORK-15E]MEA5535104.1 MBOAT family O-acyltransferase [Crocosphaera sp. XPORK-15E]
MNYSDFSFWWILILFSVPFLTVRFLAKSSNLWRGFFDSIGILVLSLLLFFHASRPSFIIFIAELIFNYLMVAWMLRCEGIKAKAIATTVIIIDIAILAYFKYFTFFVEDVIGLLINIPENWKELSPIPVSNRIPPGLSFYTFQMVAFVVDSFTARKKKAIGFIDYVNFVSFFPQIVAGPIERRRDLLPQIESFRFKFTIENFETGLKWISLGFFMKFVLADNIAPYIDLKIADNAWIVWFFALLFTLRIYFDFAGYSFVAVGLAYFLGVKLTVNFLAPYTSQSINEFWRRWHVTLSTWFRDYVFLPLMGSNKKWAAFYLFLTFTLSGFWHGAAWNFIIWGAYHGALLLVLRYLGRPFYGFLGNYIPRPQVVSWFLTFSSVTLGCLFFMETNSHRLLTKLQTLVTPSAYSLNNLQAVFGSYSINETLALLFVLALSTFILVMEQIAVWQGKFEYDLLLSRWLSPVLLGLTILLAANTPSEFIYFEF